ncbi:hypothetical protein C6A85_000000107815 [Mycobacterium sp. ITM-2017-0098]|nr:hypothetical protein C6A85_000000107815 [Mycobacterium sp. ITM-2017-0098]
MSSPPDLASDDDTSTRIIRRAPLSTGSEPASAASEPPTSILRRHPTGAIPTDERLREESANTDQDLREESAPGSDPATQIVPRAKPTAVGPPRPARLDARSAIATAVMSILSGWASGVIATDLITGWWATDWLFCVAVGFLAAVSAAASISGVVALLLRRRTARLLIVVGAVIALLIFGSLFVAGASLPALVFALPLLPLASIVLAALPATARWSRSG